MTSYSGDHTSCSAKTNRYGTLCWYCDPWNKYITSWSKVKPMDVTPDDILFMKLKDGVNFTEDVLSEKDALVVETYKKILRVKVSELCMDSSPKKIE